MKVKSSFDEIIAVLVIEDILSKMEESDSSMPLLSRLKSLSFYELSGITKGCIKADLNIDVKKMENLVTQVEIEKQSHEDFVWSVKNGATNSMLSEMFPTKYDEAEFARLRKGVVSFKRRSRIKNEDDQHEITQVWEDAQAVYSDSGSKSAKTFWCLKQVHEATGKRHDLASIFALIKQGEQQ